MIQTSRNLELKVASSADGLAAARAHLERLTCQPLQLLHQVDTYYRAPKGRLKVRELRAGADHDRVERAELIAYDRPGEPTSRWSAYLVVPIAASAVDALLGALELTHGTLTRVEKARQVAIVGHTRVHLDDVVGLGAFIELETVVAGQSDAAARAEHDQVIALLGLDPATAIAGSYGDLLQGQENRGP